MPENVSKMTLLLSAILSLALGLGAGFFGGYKWGSNANADKPVECAPELKRVLEGRK